MIISESAIEAIPPTTTPNPPIIVNTRAIPEMSLLLEPPPLLEPLSVSLELFPVSISAAPYPYSSPKRSISLLVEKKPFPLSLSAMLLFLSPEPERTNCRLCPYLCIFYTCSPPKRQKARATRLSALASLLELRFSPYLYTVLISARIYPLAKALPSHSERSTGNFGVWSIIYGPLKPLSR